MRKNKHIFSIAEGARGEKKKQSNWGSKSQAKGKGTEIQTFNSKVPIEIRTRGGNVYYIGRGSYDKSSIRLHGAAGKESAKKVRHSGRKDLKEKASKKEMRFPLRRDQRTVSFNRPNISSGERIFYIIVLGVLDEGQAGFKGIKERERAR